MSLRKEGIFWNPKRDKYAYAAILLVVVISLLYGLRYLDIKYRFEFWGDFIPTLINRALMQDWDPKIAGFDPATGGHRYCPRTDQPDWYYRKVSECRLVTGYSGPSPCGFWTYGYFCGLIAIPRDYISDKNFMRLLAGVIRTPCKYFSRIDQLELGKWQKYIKSLEDRFHCIDVDYQKYSIGVVVLDVVSTNYINAWNAKPLSYFFHSSRSSEVQYHLLTTERTIGGGGKWRILSN